MQNSVFKFIKKRQTSSGNKSGTSLITIRDNLQIPIEELKTILNELFKENKIIVRQGINDKLVFLKKIKP